MPKKLEPETLSQRLASQAKISPREPVWAGPQDAGDRGGITQSMLSDFIMCRERFRLKVVEGLDLAPTFNHRLEYGAMWHVCEEEHAKPKLGTKQTGWVRALNLYAKKLCEKYRLQQEQIVHWRNVCEVQFPIYVKYWAKHQDVKERTPLLQEHVFHVPYALPSGRTVYLRGKWDSVDLIGEGKSAGIYIQENKTKGDIQEEVLKRQLASGFDLQTMFYLTALVVFNDDPPPTWKCPGPGGTPVAGVRYNVVRRPLSGGKHSIKQKQGQTAEAFYAELGERIAGDPECFFMRWRVEISRADIERFRRQCLDPLLELVCDWWEWVKARLDTPHGVFGWPSNNLHWRTPYGLYNILAEGGNADIDEYLNTGSTVGLVRGAPLFRELQG